MSKINIYNIVVYDTAMSKLHALANSRKWALKSIVHDRDEGKKPHVHAILLTNIDLTFAEVKELLTQSDVEGNVFVQACRDLERSYRYLTHDGWNNKAQYDSENIMTTNGQVIEDELVRQSFTTPDQDLLEDLLSPDFSHIAMARKYGRDYMVNIRSYLEFRRLCQAEILIKDVQEQEYREAEEAKRRMAEAEAQAQKRRYDEVVAYCLEHWNEAPTPDDIGQWDVQRYIGLFEWMRNYRRSRDKVRVIPVWMLRHLPKSARDEIVGLIHKRMNDGYRYRWEDEEPDIVEQLWLAQNGKAQEPVYCKRFDVFNPSTESDYE